MSRFQCALFRRVLNTKMPELSGLDDEEADISEQGATPETVTPKRSKQTRIMLTKSSMRKSETRERETWFCWSRRDKTRGGTP